MDSTAPLAPGSVLTFTLANGLSGACRVLRAPDAAEAAQYAGHSLVCATRWVGEPRDALGHPDTTKLLKPVTGPALFWVAGPPPAAFAPAGVVASARADLAKRSDSTAPWEIFPNIVVRQWQHEHAPDVAAAQRAGVEHEALRVRAAEIDALAAHEAIDLGGVVPLAQPPERRSPEDVLRGFVAAMHRWECEAARIAAKTGATLVPQFSAPALERVFDEFCTARDRANGRRGSFSTPPEYDPSRETIAAVVSRGPRKVELATERRGVTVERVVYVLVKSRGAWRLDGRAIDGRRASL